MTEKNLCSRGRWGGKSDNRTGKPGAGGKKPYYGLRKRS